MESAGKDVKTFKKGDAIVASTGMAGGGHAQYVCLPEKGALALKSESLTWEEAVAIPFGANTALYFLRNLGKIQAGQEVLIIGASAASATPRCNWPNTLGRRSAPCAVARPSKW